MKAPLDEAQLRALARTAVDRHASELERQLAASLLLRAALGHRGPWLVPNLTTTTTTSEET